MAQNRSFLLALATMAAAMVFVFTLSLRGDPVVLQTNLERIPMEISGYTGTEDYFSASVYELLDVDKSLYRHYRSPDGKQVSLYIGYYGTAKGGRTYHNPYDCLPYGGWLIVERDKIEHFPSYRPEGVTLNHVISVKDDIYNVMLHWYQSGGTRILSTGVQQNLERFMGRVLENRNDGAYVQVNTFVREQNIQQAMDIVYEFAKEILEYLPDHWPEEGSVRRQMKGATRVIAGVNDED